MFETCKETVSVLYAVIFGTDGACLDIGIGSLLWAFVAFMVMVIILQFGARKLWNWIRDGARRGGTGVDDDSNGQDEGPIRSSRR